MSVDSQQASQQASRVMKEGFDQPVELAVPLQQLPVDVQPMNRNGPRVPSRKVQDDARSTKLQSATHGKVFFLIQVNVP